MSSGSISAYTATDYSFIPADQVWLVGKQGTTWELTLSLVNSETETAVDLTGKSARGQIRTGYTASSVTAEWTCSIASPETDGDVSISLSETTTAGLTAYRDSIDPEVMNTYTGSGIYLYDIEVYGTGDVKRYIEGKLFIDPEITR